MLKLFRRSAEPEGDAALSGAGQFTVGESTRVYSIGDVHGRRDLLERLLEDIISDCEQRGPVDVLRIILLGDLVDRGEDSSGVVDLAMSMARRLPGFRCLKGNHEEMFLLALSGDRQGIDLFRRMGRETLLSYGIDAELIDKGDTADLFADMMRHVPAAHRNWLHDLPDWIVMGDYLFVHAGIRPGVPLEDQAGQDMRWIRAEFLKSRASHPHMVIHGHSITTEVDVRPNRIGIDTGAYATDRLTAIGLEGTERWFLST